MPQQWRNCPDKQRAKVPGINLAIRDMANPCQLARNSGVQLRKLRAFAVRDGQTGETKNDFMIARNANAPLVTRTRRRRTA
jgi:hypothetical protein